MLVTIQSLHCRLIVWHICKLVTTQIYVVNWVCVVHVGYYSKFTLLIDCVICLLITNENLRCRLIVQLAMNTMAALNKSLTAKNLKNGKLLTIAQVCRLFLGVHNVLQLDPSLSLALLSSPLSPNSPHPLIVSYTLIKNVHGNLIHILNCNSYLYCIELFIIGVFCC